MCEGCDTLCMKCVQWVIDDMDKVSTEAEELEMVRQEQTEAKKKMPKALRSFKKRKGKRR